MRASKIEPWPIARSRRTTRLSEAGHFSAKNAICCFLSLLLAGPAKAVTGATSVELRNFGFVPVQIELAAGSPVVLKLENTSPGRHSFDAPQFFSAARLDPASARLVNGGRIEVPPHASVAIRLTPAHGSYPLKCGHAFHGLLGMRGVIIVR